MSNIEKAMMLVDSVARINPVVVAHVSGSVEAAHIRRALDFLQRRHGILGAHIEEPEPHRPWFVSEGTASATLQVETRSDDNHWEEALYEEMNRRQGGDNLPLWRARALIGASRADIILGFNHSIADGRSIMVAMRELLEFLQQIRSGLNPEVETLPESPSQDALLKPKLRTLRGLWWAFRSVLRVLWVLLVLRPAKMPDDTPVPIEQGRSRTLHRNLPPEQVAAIARRAKLEGTNLHGAMCAALVLSMAAHIQRRTGRRRTLNIGCMSAIDQRPLFDGHTLDGMGCYTSVAVIMERVSAEPDFWALARAQQRDLHARRASGEVVAFAALQSAVAPRRVNPHFAARTASHPFWGAGAVTNLGVLNMPEQFGDLRLDAVHAVGATVAYGNFVSLAAMTFRKRTTLNMTYTEPQISTETAQSLADDVIRRLSGASELPAAGTAHAVADSAPAAQSA